MALTLPAAYLSGLSDTEAATYRDLINQLGVKQAEYADNDSYYNARRRVQDLGISIPPQMRQVDTVLGWGALPVDSIADRLEPVGMRFPGQVDADDDLWGIWQANNLDAEVHMAFVDALALGCSFMTVGSPDGDGAPLVTVESPFSMAAQFDARTRRLTAALRVVSDDESVLYLPDQTIRLERQPNLGMRVVDRDKHNLGRPMVVRMANRQRPHDRSGASEITATVKSLFNSACRTLLGVEIAREFYSAPQRYILGANESAFQSADGTPKPAWETYLGRYLALEADEDGNVPQVGQFTPYSPGVYTELIDMYAKQMASQTGLPAHYLGLTTDNPASADAIRSSEMRLVKRAQRRQTVFGDSLEEVMRLCLLVQRGGVLPSGSERLETLWENAATPTPAADTDAFQKQVAMGYMPKRSTVIGDHLGYTPTEQARIALEWADEDAETVLAALGESLTSGAVAGNGGVEPANP